LTYDALCSDCPYAGEVEKPMAADFPTACPACGGDGLRQDYARKTVILQDLTPKTWGQQSDRNRRERPDLAPPPKEVKPTPWWREPGAKPLDLSAVKDVAKFVETGEKS
jgi:hypothetical protein